MRLLLISQDFPPQTGGTQTYAIEVAQRLSRVCEEFTAVARHVPGAARHDALLPFEVKRVRTSSDWFTLNAFRPISQLAVKRQIDTIFHVQWNSAVPSLALRSRSRRLFIAAHGRELVLEPLPFPLNRVYNSIRKRVLTAADGLFPVSHFTADLLRRIGVSSERISVVHNGTDPTRFSPQDASRLSRQLGVSDRTVLLTVSRLVARKGIDTTLRALPRIVAAIPDLVYLIIGQGPDLPRLQAIAREVGVTSRVKFLGAVADDRLGPHYNVCDVFVMPSRHEHPDVEGFGIAFLEANACGKPVVGTRSGGIPDAVHDGETGLLVDQDDEDGLASALIYLLTHADVAQRFGQQGRDRVLAESTWDHIVAKLCAAMAPNHLARDGFKT